MRGEKSLPPFFLEEDMPKYKGTWCRTYYSQGEGVVFAKDDDEAMTELKKLCQHYANKMVHEPEADQYHVRLLEQYACGNCDYIDEKEMMKDLSTHHLYERFQPGDIFTDKECPKCGALCFPSSFLV